MLNRYPNQDILCQNVFPTSTVLNIMNISDRFTIFELFDIFILNAILLHVIFVQIVWCQYNFFLDAVLFLDIIGPQYQKKHGKWKEYIE